MNEILLSILPAVVVLAIGIYYYERNNSVEKSRQNFESRRLISKQSYPAKLQAYERLILFLERINPESLLPRTIGQHTNILNFQNALIAGIREEFEHNLSQQLYVSEGAWFLIVRARESIVHLINVSLAEMKENASVIDLSTTILEKYAAVSKSPTSEAIKQLKEEFNHLI